MELADLNDCITDFDGLRSIYREPGAIPAAKEFSVIDETTATFIDTCPFLVIATTDAANSVDASPRGGPPGFLQRLGDRHVAIPDLNGNNRLDTLENIVRHGRVGLLLLVPGTDETVRINGPAVITTDASVLDGFTNELRRPKSAIVVETAELYVHCAKAFRRSGLWAPESWPSATETPDLVDIVKTQFGPDLELTREVLDEVYEAELAED